MSEPLVIEYVLDERRPGYKFTSATDGYDDKTLKDIWRSAMPRGQGWRELIGARSLKCFPLEGGRRVALSDVTVTDQEDETGRTGIRHATITVIDADAYFDQLKLRLVMLPEAARDAATRRLTWRRWQRILKRATPKMRQQKSQVVLAYPYTSTEDWLVAEAALLTVATSFKLRAVKGWPSVTPITTLTLDHREESRIVAIPLAKARQLSGAAVIDIS